MSLRRRAGKLSTSGIRKKQLNLSSAACGAGWLGVSRLGYWIRLG